MKMAHIHRTWTQLVNHPTWLSVGATAVAAAAAAAATTAYAVAPQLDAPRASSLPTDRSTVAPRFGTPGAAPFPPAPSLPGLPASVIATNFGLELETNLPVRVGKKALKRADVPLQKFFARRYSGWRVVRDGKAEFVSPVLNAGSYPDVEKVLTSIRAEGDNPVKGVHRGLHIHLDAKTMSADTLLHMIDLYYHSESVFQRMVGSTYRRVDTWCRPLEKTFLVELAATKPDTVQGIQGVWDRTVGERYRGFNLAALRKHQTVELRLFKANEDMEYIDGCIALAQRLVTTAKERGRFDDWDRFANPAPRAREPVPVLEALGFATSGSGLKRLQNRLVEAFAQHPEIDLEKLPHPSELEPMPSVRITPQWDDMTEEAVLHPFTNACATGDARQVGRLMDAATDAQLRDYVQRGNALGLRSAAFHAHAGVITEIINTVNDRLGAETVDALCATHNFALFGSAPRPVSRALTAWSNQRSERYRCAVFAAEGWGTHDGDPVGALAAYDAEQRARSAESFVLMFLQLSPIAE